MQWNRRSRYWRRPLVATAAAGERRNRCRRRRAQLGPHELVTKVAQDTLRDLDAHRAEYQKDPGKVRQLVDKNMLPYFDTAYCGAAGAGEALAHRDAGTAQALRRGVLSVDAAELWRGAAGVHAGPPENPAVPGQCRRTPRPRCAAKSAATTARAVPVNYSLRKTPAGWKAYDVQIEGVSYVKSFRTDFGSEIRAEGAGRGDPAPGIAGCQRHCAQADRQVISCNVIRNDTAPVSKAQARSKAKIESLGGGRLRRQRRAGCDHRDGPARSRAASASTASARIEVDLAAVTESDSSGLALVIEWLRLARDGRTADSFRQSAGADRWRSRASAKSMTCSLQRRARSVGEVPSGLLAGVQAQGLPGARL